MIRLEWSPPESDGGTIIRRFEYRLKEGLEEFGEWTPIADSRPDEVNATGYTVEGLFNGTVYVIELRAVNSVGNGPASQGVAVRMPLVRTWWSNFRAEDLEGSRLWLEAPLLEGGLREQELRFGEGLRFEQDRLDSEGEVTATRSGSYGYVYTSRTTGEMRLVYDGGERCELSLTFSEEGGGNYGYGCGGVLEREGGFGLSRLNRAPEIRSTGPFEVEENRTRVGQVEALDPDEEDEVTGYGIGAGADGALFRVGAVTGELRFLQAPDYEDPRDVKSEDPASEAGDNEYIVVVEVTSGEGERERSRGQAIRVRVIDVEDDEGGAQDPSAFTEEDLEGRRLSLRQTGEEGMTSLQLRFGEGNRFEEIRQEAAVPAGTPVRTARAQGSLSRLGTYTYERTGPGMGTIRLDYDDGSSCQIRLSFTGSGVGAYAYDCGEGVLAEGSFRLTTGSLFVPVILSAAGRNNSHFTSELTLTNRGEGEARLDYRYTAHRGGGSGRAQEVLEAGSQRIETNALTYLRSLGVPIPERGNRIGTLRVGVELGSEVEAVVRTTTVVPDGRAGLAYLGVAEEEGFSEPVYLCGLRQNSRDRSNLALQNMGAPGEGAITLRTTVYSGEADDATARVLEDVELEPGGFHQFSPVLGSVAHGYVKVERVEGEAPFYAYGVINDQANSDGSFI
ncbi:MAG: fibronectin type III domain-containing protein, partial [Candidatus Aminicenantes bacterium]|nr:fibronectin type III domain-containing protein [Candidatus Aminicenantes bacterium]